VVPPLWLEPGVAVSRVWMGLKFWKSLWWLGQGFVDFFLVCRGQVFVESPVSGKGFCGVSGVNRAGFCRASGVAGTGVC
jgi:hypothetical protein